MNASFAVMEVWNSATLLASLQLALRGCLKSFCWGCGGQQAPANLYFAGRTGGSVASTPSKKRHLEGRCPSKPPFSDSLLAFRDAQGKGAAAPLLALDGDLPTEQR